jgi:hypothetical protein
MQSIQLMQHNQHHMTAVLSVRFKRADRQNWRINGRASHLLNASLYPVVTSQAIAADMQFQLAVKPGQKAPYCS